MSQDIRHDWKKWSKQLNLLKNLQISQCFKSPKFGKIKQISSYHFSDASDSGQASVLRLVSESRRINSRLLMGKACVAFIEYMTIACSSNFIAQDLSTTTEGTLTC